MSSTGLLVLSNLKNITNTLSAVKKYVNRVLYVHLLVNNNDRKLAPPTYSPLITNIYKEVSTAFADVDVRILVTPLKTQHFTKLSSNIDVLLFDHKCIKDIESFADKYQVEAKPIFLDESSVPLIEVDACDETADCKVYDTVVLGGTFDRIHLGHKLLLTEAVLRTKKRLVVGVTDSNMLSSKILSELILPVEQRIKDVCEFLNDVDSTLLYEVVPIQDIFGPTKSDPNMDMIVVSAETKRGGDKINEIRALSALKILDVHCIDLIELDSQEKHKEMKISSSNRRMDMLGTRLKKPEPRSNLPNEPYIIGLVGGIASGKTHMARRLEKLGAKVIDCDKLAHEAYEPGTECFRSVVEYFGKEIVGEDGKIDRKCLGRIVFSDPEKLKKLNEIVWPYILKEAKQRVRDAFEKEGKKVSILDAAVLLQAGWDTECHEVWSMIIPQNEAVKRIMERNGLTEDQAKQRLSAQWNNQKVVNKSNVVFCSLWSHEFSEEQAKRAWDMLMKELEGKC